MEHMAGCGGDYRSSDPVVGLALKGENGRRAGGDDRFELSIVFSLRRLAGKSEVVSGGLGAHEPC